MSIDSDFLNKLRCPRTHRPLRPATAAERDALNAAIAAGGVANLGGQSVVRALEDGLVPDGESFVYPVDDGIPILLVDEAIPLVSA